MKNIEDFKHHVDLYSADLSLWPVDKVKPGLSFMEENREAKRYFDDMVAAESQLRAYADNIQVSPDLESRIMAQINDMSVAKGAPASLVMAGKAFHWQPQRFLAPGGGLLAVLLLATFIGLSPPEGMDYVMKKPSVQATMPGEGDYLPFIWEEAE